MHADRINALLQDVRLTSETNHELVQQVRKLVLAAGSSIKEEVKYGGILFSASVPFCGVFAYAKHVSLEFSRGASMPDEYRVLEGEGKSRRHVKLSSLADIRAKHLKHYVALAYAAAIQAK
ncbi:MAG: hypothetical protein A3I66_17680 [Burkholderiales bacterium RIFCSPLOWO2_02_FULL_57_36]|nr:MAG: hypothetical protein A3I66_17680 [Burkholderiales bacterium RIFCSPLOWO2_02_FULL_57_36]